MRVIIAEFRSLATEFTCLRNDARSDFPHALDADKPARREMLLPACWYRHP
jgi:hypothetical protein